MSHYIYKKKAFIELKDGRILPLCLHADSGVSSYNYDRNGRKHYFHPKSRGINTMGAEPKLLVDKQKFNDAVKRAYEKELDLLREYMDRYGTDREEPGKDSCNYFGNVYPSGRKMRDMKSFCSTGHTVPAEGFPASNQFDISIASYNPKDYRNIEKETVHISTVEDLIKADEVYMDIRGRNGHMCIGIYGLDGAD